MNYLTENVTRCLPRWMWFGLWVTAALSAINLLLRDIVWIFS